MARWRARLCERISRCRCFAFRVVLRDSEKGAGAAARAAGGVPQLETRPTGRAAGALWSTFAAILLCLYPFLPDSLDASAAQQCGPRNLLCFR